MGVEDHDKILEELTNGTPWATVAEKYQVSTRTISELLSHRHCIVCATTIFMGEVFCGPVCQETFRRAERRRKRLMLLPLLLFLPFLLLILLLGRR
jgi:predicted nucleic acid-binding Zn ribbon protein